jgi:AraC family transcriptional regulator, glycine betaine-responsive activator
MASAPAKLPVRIGFLTLPDYSLIAFGNAVDPLRMANRLSGSELFAWSVVTPDGNAARASNGLTIAPTIALKQAGPLDMLFVCGGINVQKAVDQSVIKALRSLARARVPLGGLCTGSYSLARAGLLDDYRCAVHWENMAAMREEFPRTVFAPELFIIDRDRYTCSGGVAPLDLMLNLIKARFGSELAASISEQFIVERIRDANDRQHVPVLARVGRGHDKLVQAAVLMEANTEEPMSLDELANCVGLSRRQLERLFKKHLNCAPTRYYLEIRLRRARELLLQTDMSVLEVTTASGFQSAPHFSKSYRNLFGHPPSAERNRGSSSSRGSG